MGERCVRNVPVDGRGTSRTLFAAGERRARGQESGARSGGTFKYLSETEPQVTLRYFGHEVNPDAPETAAHRSKLF
jgi:hypothetical protein